MTLKPVPLQPPKLQAWWAWYWSCATWPVYMAYLDGPFRQPIEIGKVFGTLSWWAI